MSRGFGVITKPVADWIKVPLKPAVDSVFVPPSGVPAPAPAVQPPSPAADGASRTWVSRDLRRGPGVQFQPSPWKVPVEQPSAIFTSQPYPVVTTEEMMVTHAFVGGKFMSAFWDESLDVSHALVSGALLQPLKAYGDWPDESLDVTHALTGGVLTVVLKTYADWPDESLDVTHALVSGVIVDILKTYNEWPAESLDVTHALVSGVLT